MSASRNLKGLLAGVAAVAVIGTAIAQGTPPNANKSAPIGAGQQSSQGTPMGTTGTPGGSGATGSTAAGSTSGSSNMGSTNSGSGSTMNSGTTGSGSTGSGTSMGSSSTSADTSGTTRPMRSARADRN